MESSNVEPQIITQSPSLVTTINAILHLFANSDQNVKIKLLKSALFKNTYRKGIH